MAPAIIATACHACVAQTDASGNVIAEVLPNISASPPAVAPSASTTRRRLQSTGNYGVIGSCDPNAVAQVRLTGGMQQCRLWTELQIEADSARQAVSFRACRLDKVPRHAPCHVGRPME